MLQLLRENGVSEYATSWMVSLLRQLGHRKGRLQSVGEPSFVALKTATSLAAPYVALVCVSVQLESMPPMVLFSLPCVRQTRTLKFALEAHVGKIVESHSIFTWVPMMASDAISFFWIDRDGLTAEMRRSGRAWKKLVAGFRRMNEESRWVVGARRTQKRDSTQPLLVLEEVVGDTTLTTWCAWLCSD